VDDIRLISVDAIPIPSIIEHKFALVKHGLRTLRAAYAELRERAKEIENRRSRF
jgi:hypothetical protein